MYSSEIDRRAGYLGDLSGGTYREVVRTTGVAVEALMRFEHPGLLGAVEHTLITRLDARVSPSLERDMEQERAGCLRGHFKRWAYTESDLR